MSCTTGIGFRNIDNHQSHPVQVGWQVRVTLTSRTTQGRRFDWQVPKVSPAGVLTPLSVHRTGDGGIEALWTVTGKGTTRVTFAGKRMSPSHLTPREKSLTGLYEATLTTQDKVPGTCVVRTGVLRG